MLVKLYMPIISTILCSCTSLTAVVSATKFASNIQYENPKRPEFKYKTGDKIQLWGLWGPSKLCEVLYATSNPYSPEPMLAKYEVKCPSEPDSRTVTSDDLERMNQYREMHLKDKTNRKPASTEQKD